MTDCKKAFIDTAPFIYFIEKDQNNPYYFEKTRRFLEDCTYNDIPLVTSVITVEEYMVYPYRSEQPIYAEIFERLINALDIQIIEINTDIAKLAARIRADYKSFKAMDSLQLATATFSSCDLFLTNDKQLKQYRGIRCITVNDLS